MLQFRRSAEKEWLGHIRVAEVMTTDLITVAADADVEEAVTKLLDRKIGCLPVLRAGKLIGLLSETDCLRYLRRILAIADVKRRIAQEPPLEIS